MESQNITQFLFGVQHFKKYSRFFHEVHVEYVNIHIGLSAPVEKNRRKMALSQDGLMQRLKIFNILWC